MSPESVAPEKAKKLIEQSALLIDIRDTTEYLREHIPGACSFPLTDIQAGKKDRKPRATPCHLPLYVRWSHGSKMPMRSWQQQARCQL